ncbi:MAG: alpha-amylase/4-alpha-glucanotransferase domain-containing protein [Chloroflexia bacterium]
MGLGDAVRASERQRDGETYLRLENGESRLVVVPARGGRLTEWELALGGGPALRLMGAPDAPVSTGRAMLVGRGGLPEVVGGLGPASPSGMGDHFLPLSGSQRDFALGKARELGTFAGGAFSAAHYSPAHGQQEVALRCEGGIRGAKRVTPLTLLKKLTLGRPGTEISIHYRLENPNEKPVQILFGVEFCFALSDEAAADGGERTAYEFDGARERGGFGVSGVATDATSVGLIEPQPGVTLRLGWERAASVWVCPYPAGGSAHTGASVTAVWDLALPPEDNWAVNIWLQAGASGPVAPLDPAVVARIARPESEDEPWKGRQ